MSRTFQLHRGALTFTVHEFGSGPLVLCLHGFPENPRSFRLQVPALVAAGFRVVVPTMRGYEPSSQPRDGDYHMLHLAEDVLAWLEELREERCHLVGHDWGAVVAYVAAGLAPERFASLTTLAIAHPGRIERELLTTRPSQLLKSWYMFLFQLRGIAEYVFSRRDFALMETLCRDWSPGYELPADELVRLKQTFAQPGVTRAALSYYRALFAFFSENHRRMRKVLSAPLPVPTLALTGECDGAMDTRLHDDLMRVVDFPAGLRVERVRGAGHFLHQERPQEVNRLLLSWLQRYSTVERVASP
ncbi:MAG: alpha/beta hydrolase [Myxococcales bacterium]